MPDFNTILTDRCQCIVFRAEKYVDGLNGWLGGNIPEYFVDHIDSLNCKNEDYYFYLTLTHPFDAKKMFSIFVPRDYEVLLDKNIYPNCSVLLFEHTYSKESSNTNFTNFNIKKHNISGGQMLLNQEADNDFYLIKFGGIPDLIQKESFYYLYNEQCQVELKASNFFE